MAALAPPPTATPPPVATSDAYLAYDWQICIRGLGPIRMGAIGRTDSLELSRRRAVEALKELPPDVPAHAEVIERHVLVESHQRLLEVGTRGRDRSIAWTQI